MTYYDCIYRVPDKGPCIQSWRNFPEDHQIRDHLHGMHGIVSPIISSEFLKNYIKEVEE